MCCVFSIFRQIHVHYVGMSCQQMMPTMKNIGNKRFDIYSFGRLSQIQNGMCSCRSYSCHIHVSFLSIWNCSWCKYWSVLMFCCWTWSVLNIPAPVSACAVVGSSQATSVWNWQSSRVNVWLTCSCELFVVYVLFCTFDRMLMLFDLLCPAHGTRPNYWDIGRG